MGQMFPDYIVNLLTITTVNITTDLINHRAICNYSIGMILVR